MLNWFFLYFILFTGAVGSIAWEKARFETSFKTYYFLNHPLNE